MHLPDIAAIVATAFLLILQPTIADSVVDHVTTNCSQISPQGFHLNILPHNQPITNAKALVLTKEYGRFSHDYFYWLTHGSNDSVPATLLTLLNGNLHAVLQESSSSSSSLPLHLTSESMPPQVYILFNTSTVSEPGHLSLADTPVGCALALQGIADEWGFCSAVYSEHKQNVTLNCDPNQGLKWLLAR